MEEKGMGEDIKRTDSNDSRPDLIPPYPSIADELWTNERHRLEARYEEARRLVHLLSAEYRSNPTEAALERIREANDEANRFYGEYADFIGRRYQP
jgi:hypothetical protein